uniref:Uncharacterized protein n=1 Tax=Anguilla anguilla TaxID=7936 RepID=A0A0E9TDX3_ANGAN
MLFQGTCKLAFLLKPSHHLKVFF